MFYCEKIMINSKNILCLFKNSIEPKSHETFCGMFHIFTNIEQEIPMNKFSLLAVFALVGCSMSEDKFQTDSIAESCRLIFECTPEVAEMLSLADEAACVDTLTEAAEEADNSACTYDAAKASECINEAKAVSCDDYSAGNGMDACDSVYTCDEEAAEDGGDEAAE